MLTLRYARQSRSLYPPSASATATVVFSSTSVDLPSSVPSTFAFPLSYSTSVALAELPQSEVTYFFREWFLSRKSPLYDRIFETLRTHVGSSSDAALSGFNLRLTEDLVLDVLNYNQKEVLSCLKFFDWAGRQPGFFHTRATFNAIFRILSKAKLTNLMLDFLQNYEKSSNNGRVAYHNVLVIGYAMAGECETALGVFGRMRFRGQDLDPIAYNMLLNSLVEKSHFSFVESVAKDIKIRGCQNYFTHSVIVRSYCRQNELERAEEYLRGLAKDNVSTINGYVLSTLVAELCKNNQFEKASVLIEEFKGMGLHMMDKAYSAWIGEVVKSGNTDYALKFLKDKRVVDEYVPDVFRFNLLICRLLRENRLKDVCDLLLEMNKKGVVPDDTTINAVLCFLCKAGMMDSAMALFDSRVELGFSVNRMAYNYLINTLLGEATAEESYDVLKKSLEQGNFPGVRTLSIVGDALCREGKLDKMKELVTFILDQNLTRSNIVFDKFISALCRVNKVEEGYLLHNLVARVNKGTQKLAYYNMTYGFARADRGDIAARLLIEMQDNGYRPSRRLFKAVICSICKMDNQGNLFYWLLDMQLARNVLQPSVTFDIFIHAAGQAGKPELAAEVYEMMKRSGHVPGLKSSILLLHSYLKNRKVSHALVLFCDMSKKWKKKKLQHAMIVGLSKIKELECASQMLENIQKSGINASRQCYEELIKACCDMGLYHNAIYILNDMTRLGHRVSSFIGNVFLLHALKNRELYHVWVSLSAKQNLTPATWMVGHLIGIFSGRIEGNYLDEDIEKLVQQCFRINLYTYNLMLRRLSMKGSESASKLVDALRRKGFQPNKWTYETIIQGLVREGRDSEAIMWMEEMHHKGFDFPGKSPL